MDARLRRVNKEIAGKHIYLYNAIVTEVDGIGRLQKRQGFERQDRVDR